MTLPLEDASFTFHKHLRAIAAEHSRLVERCQILEHNMKEGVGSTTRATHSMEAPSMGRIPHLPAQLAADDGVFWSRGPESCTYPHEQFEQLDLTVAESMDVAPADSFTAQTSMPSVAPADSSLTRVQLRKCWRDTSDISAENILVGPHCSSSLIHSRSADSFMEFAGHKRGPWYRTAAVDPNSVARLIFECVTICVCLYDTIVVPYELAWQPERNVALTVLAVSTVTFWWSEMGLNFVTGYMDQGVLVLDIKRTALNYFCSWFVMDLFINVADFAILVLDITLRTDHGRGPAWLKYLRIGKLNRLARIMVLFNRNRLQQVMRSLSIESSNFTLLGLGIRLIAILFLLNHLICCAWYWIGSLSGDTGKSWLDMSITSGGLHYRSAPQEFQYMTALHWSFTQMTPGSMSVVPQNSLERAWNVLCLILGLFVSALLISQFSAKMVRVQALNSTQLQQMETLGRFLAEHDVPRSLAQRIRRQLWERLSQKKMLTIEDLPSLEYLPTSLKQELYYALFARSLLSHSVLYSWCVLHDGISQDICFRVAEEEPRAKNDDIFLPGQEATKVYFLQRGSMRYRREVPLPSTGSVFDTGSGVQFPEMFLAEADWISTVAMWCHWDYVGRLQTCEACNIVCFNMEKMIAVLKGYPLIRAISRSYASAYVLLATSPEHAIQVDLDILPSRVLMAMPLDERVSFSVTLLESFQTKECQRSTMQYYPTRRQRLGPKEQVQLMEELEMGKCVVTIGKDHQLLRTVGLCVLDVVDSTGRVLVQIGTMKEGEDAVLDIGLPATKLRENESNREAAMRLIQTELPEMNGVLDFGKVLHEENEKKSKHLGIRTAYVKTTYNASLLPVQEGSNNEIGRSSHSSCNSRSSCSSRNSRSSRSSRSHKLQVNNPPANWACSQSVSPRGRNSLHRLNRAIAAGASSTASPAMVMRGSTYCKSVLSSADILPAKYRDKTKFFTWLQRQEFHEVKHAVLSNEQELMAAVQRAAERMAYDEANRQASDDSSGVDI